MKLCFNITFILQTITASAYVRNAKTEMAIFPRNPKILHLKIAFPQLRNQSRNFSEFTGMLEDMRSLVAWLMLQHTNPQHTTIYKRSPRLCKIDAESQQW